MERKKFEFDPPAWFSIRDKAVLEHCRNIKREDMEFTNENGYSIRVVPHPSSCCAVEIFERILRSDLEDKKTVIVFPNCWKGIYTSVAEMCNRLNVSCRNLHCFCIDEWADENGNVAPITWSRSLGGHFLQEFFLPLREDLRPPFSHIHYFTTENVSYYSDLIDEAGDGGADLVISATGWAGHTGFIDPSTRKFHADSLEEFLQLGSGYADNCRLTVIQNSSSYRGSDYYHTPAFSATVGPRDIMHARDHLERNDLGFLGGYSSWERMASRIQLYGPVTQDFPASIYQLTKGTIYVSEDLARPIEAMDLVAL